MLNAGGGMWHVACKKDDTETAKGQEKDVDLDQDWDCDFDFSSGGGCRIGNFKGSEGWETAKGVESWNLKQQDDQSDNICYVDTTTYYSETRKLQRLRLDWTTTRFGTILESE